MKSGQAKPQVQVAFQRNQIPGGPGDVVHIPDASSRTVSFDRPLMVSINDAGDLVQGGG